MTRMLLTFLLCFPAVLAGQHGPHRNAHSHNDYEQQRPLEEALASGFVSVEADVHLIDGELYVAHDRPVLKDPSRTLRALYLDPLKARVSAHHGRVYEGYADHFYLMVDIKSDGAATCVVLENQLRSYASILSSVDSGADEADKPIKVFVSGNRTGSPAVTFSGSGFRLFSLDGRPADLGRGIPAALMPVVSEDYWKVLSWNGVGAVDTTEVCRLRSFVAQAHAEGKKTRLWGAPDAPPLWQFLLEEGVDLINTDRIADLAGFLGSDR